MYILTENELKKNGCNILKIYKRSRIKHIEIFGPYGWRISAKTMKAAREIATHKLIFNQ